MPAARRTTSIALAAALALALGTPAASGAVERDGAPTASASAKAKKPTTQKKRPRKKRTTPHRTTLRGTREVLYVGNNWEGTATIVDGRNYRRLRTIDIIPDKEERLAEIRLDPARLGFFLGIGIVVGEGNDQYVDDMFSSHDGREIYVSRPSFSDVVAIDLKTEEIKWRVPVEGYRSDHMAISPDGSRLLVSASTARKVHVIDTKKGEIVDEFESGDQPHESNYSGDGKRIYHASIGTVYTPGDDHAFDGLKGDRWFQVVDAKTYEVKKRLDIGAILRTFGFPGMSSAVRPMAISPDEKTAYFQLSFLHGFVEFDLEENRPIRIVNLPISEKTAKLPREAYLLDSAHHGLAMSPDGRRLCVAGTMSDYAAVVDVDSMKHRIASRGSKPYWSTNSHDGKKCVVSYSGDDRIAVIDYRTKKEVASVKVGDHPQRVREGVIRDSYLD